MDARTGQLRKFQRGASTRLPIRVVIVDDSLTVRTIFSRMIENETEMEVAGTFSNAERALVKLPELHADVVLLDLEMPGMSGLEALPKILELAQNVQVLVVSSLTKDGAEHSLAALSIGAADTMLKPRAGGFDNIYQAGLLNKIRALAGAEHPDENSSEGRTRQPSLAVLNKPASPELIAIGASTGGIHALNAVLKALPPSFDLPILVTQHLPDSFVSVFARQIELTSARRTRVAENGTLVRRGEMLVAPGTGHMTVVREGEELRTRIVNFVTNSGCMPSVDPMLESVATTLGARATAVILSGMGRDGVEGAASLAGAGGSIYVQDAESSAVWGMPGSVVKAGLASGIERPEEIAKLLIASVKVPTWK